MLVKGVSWKGSSNLHHSHPVEALRLHLKVSPWKWMRLFATGFILMLFSNFSFSLFDRTPSPACTRPSSLTTQTCGFPSRAVLNVNRMSLHKLLRKSAYFNRHVSFYSAFAIKQSCRMDLVTWFGQQTFFSCSFHVICFLQTAKMF